MSGCTNDTTSVALTVSGGILSAAVKISATPGNNVTVNPDGIYVAGAPTGAVLPYAGSAAPSGWLLAQGQAVSRTTYAALFALIGTQYGVGDGSTTFNLPDIQGRVIAGLAGAGGHGDVLSLGANDGSALATRRPRHQHTVTDPTHNHGVNDPTHTHSGGFTTSGPNTVDSTDHYSIGNTNVGASATGISLNAAATGVTVGPGGAPTDAAAYVVLNHIIKT